MNLNRKRWLENQRTYDEQCPNCSGAVKTWKEKYGEDADGNRYKMIDQFECINCGWMPGDEIEQMEDKVS